MKITLETKATEEVELPKYFKNRTASYFMLTGDGYSYVKVYNVDYDPHLSIQPYIKIEPVSMLKHENLKGFEHISETEFKTAFIRVSVLMDELLNN